MAMGLGARTMDRYAEQGRALAARMKRLTNVLVANPKIATVGAIGLVAVVAVFTGYTEWKGRSEAKAAALLFKAVGAIPASIQTTEDAVRQDEGVRLLREVAKQYPRTAAGAEATLRLGNHYFALGNYDEVRVIYQGYLEQNRKGRAAFAAGLGMGDSYLAEGNNEKAAESYLRLIDEFPQDPLLPEAYMNLARTYINLKGEEKAARLYEKIVEGYPNSGWAQNAQSQLRKLVQK